MRNVGNYRQARPVRVPTFMSSGSPETVEFNRVNEWQVIMPNFNEWSFDNVPTSLTGDPNSWLLSTGTTPHMSKPSSVKVPVCNTITFKTRFVQNAKNYRFASDFTLSKHMQSIDPQTFITLVFIHES